MVKRTGPKPTRGVDEPTRKQFGLWLRTARKQLDMRQEDLARIVNVDQGTVSLWESGEIFPGAENLRELSKAFEVPIEVFLGEEGTQDEETSPGYMPRIRVVGEIVAVRQSRPAEIVVIDESREEFHLLGASLVSAAQRDPDNEIVMLRARAAGEGEYANGEMVLFERTSDESLARVGDIVIVDAGPAKGLRIHRLAGCGDARLLQSIHAPSSLGREAFSVSPWTEKTRLWGVEIGRIHLPPSGRRRKPRARAK